jgi:hypothetical protein
LFRVPIEKTVFALSARGEQQGARDDFMNQRQSDQASDEMRSEYDADVLKGGVRGTCYERYRSGTNLALLAPDVRAAFPTDEAVNQALRSLIQTDI